MGEGANARRHGQGKFTYPNGDWYSGQWIEGKASGEGTFWTRQSTYVGTWDQDLKHGKGEERFEDGATYTGEFRMGYRQGLGTLVWPDGSTYEGQFQNNN